MKAIARKLAVAAAANPKVLATAPLGGTAMEGDGEISSAGDEEMDGGTCAGVGAGAADATADPKIEAATIMRSTETLETVIATVFNLVVRLHRYVLY